MQVELQKLLTYKNNKVIEHYQNQYDISLVSAKEIFDDLLRYIWLWHKHFIDKQTFPDNSSLHFKCVMHAEMKNMDNMWHTFILFTRDYQTFCDDYLNGMFFHHDPFTSENKLISKNSYEIELRKYLLYIYENLGEETLLRWFDSEVSP